MNDFWDGVDPRFVSEAGEFMSYYEDNLDSVIDTWLLAYDRNEMLPQTAFYALLVEGVRLKSVDGKTPNEVDFLNLCMNLTTAIYRLGMYHIKEREHQCQEVTDETPEAPAPTVDKLPPRRSFLRRFFEG